LKNVIVKLIIGNNTTSEKSFAVHSEKEKNIVIDNPDAKNNHIKLQ